ncbi:CDP-alcohol phosphatidyltransferase family protein [Deinococcus taeanensis]|uniref:CDP-alcohol phosphatidyltransferase family protein n=1 Tax=Deinococcus taeanensis TaxID=2737050 RepID=UPI001CDCBF6F|nr:CDP-alcohol phosphatidyltransferase family protein [Deinococcus taeanensis]UBV42248.1 CDP-alcohol phosphatidyltransferase family protein [Deinococcus taeanensis]
MFRPAAQLLVDPLARLNVDPQHVVLFHTALGLHAAHLIGRGDRLTPALLLQLKTLLDNLDGQLARATGRTTETGRYLDTEMDLLVNLALNVAISGRSGLPWTVLQSLILTVDFLWEREYREARGEVFRESPAQAGDHPVVLGALKAVYAAYFVPQERLLHRVFEQRLRRVAGGGVTPADRVAYTSAAVNALSANLGLSTQLALLGACVLLGRPQLYHRSLLVQAAALLGAQVWREQQVRAAHAARR